MTMESRFSAILGGVSLVSVVTVDGADAQGWKAAGLVKLRCHVIGVRIVVREERGERMDCVVRQWRVVDEWLVVECSCGNVEAWC